MKFIPISENTAEEVLLKSEYKQSRKIGRVGLGETIFFFKNKMRINYIPIQNIYRAFRRVKCIPVRICCGKGELQLDNIVLCSKQAELVEIDLPNEKSTTAILEYLQEKNPNVKIGKKQ